MFDSSRPTWNNPRVLGILALVFFCGAVSGAFVMRVFLHDQMHYRNSIFRHDSLLSYEKLSSELNLTPDQRRSLKTILDDYVRYHDDLQAQLKDFRATGKSQIMQILAPEQRARFEQLAKQAENAN